MTHDFKINPERLRALLARRNLSQKDLAEKMGMDAGTLSRWMRGKITKIRGHTLDQLCEVLKTTPSELRGDGPLPESSKDGDAAYRGQVTFMLDTACRNVLALVARRYGVTRQQIVEIAPLLFAVMAEQSLAERRNQLQAIKDALGDIENSAPQHLRNWLRAPSDSDDQELLESEERSIEGHDLFAARVGGWDEHHSKDNPFARFLHEKLSETGLPHGGTVRWDEDESPRYMIGIDELVELLGKDKDACLLVLNGKVALAEMPGDTRKGTPEIRASWVKEKAALTEQELRAVMGKVDWENLDFDDLAKKLGEAVEQRKYDF